MTTVAVGAIALPAFTERLSVEDWSPWRIPGSC
jgi:hypothetical protein